MKHHINKFFHITFTVLIGFVLLGSSPSVAFARTPSDPLLEQQWYLSRIMARDAWDTTTGSRSVIVAVLDTGFDEDHPELVGNLWTNPGEVAGDGRDNDNNGFIDDLHGYDFVSSDGDAVPRNDGEFDQEAVPHGTVIAGIIGAKTDNGEGIAGINWNVRMMNLRILDNLGSGDSGAATAAIDYAVSNGADVVNLSFTGFDVDPEFRRALQRAFEAGVMVVAAVGNDENGGLNIDETPIYPVCFGENAQEDWIIGVGATDQDDHKSVFSNYGATCTDISAPGEMIASTMFQDKSWPAFSQDAAYVGGWSGTSMAAPMVSGAAALLKAKYPTLNPTQIKSILRLSADPIIADGASTGKTGAGRLNLAKAFEIAPSFLGTVSTASIPETKTNTLVKTACTEQATVDDPCRAVYFYASDGKRHAFPNERVFFTWFADFQGVVTISKESMASIPLGKNVTYRPGVKLVKFQSVRTVYAVSSGSVLRPIASQQIASLLYGETWNKQIDDIPDVFRGNYSIGKSIEQAEDYDRISELASVADLDEHFLL